jgi:hypothetical protein
MRANRFPFAAAVAAAIALAASASAQPQFSVSNYLRYGNGTQRIAGLKEGKEYIENQTDVRFFWNNFTVGLRYLHDDPPEFGPDTTGLRKRYVEFEREGLALLAGDYYALFGKGLAVNLFENRGINYDTGLEGLRGIYRSKLVEAVAASGRMRYFDLVDPRRVEIYAVKTGHLEVSPLPFLRVGGSVVGTDGELPAVFGTDLVRADISEATLSLRGFGVDAFASWAQKRSSGERPQAGSTFAPFHAVGDGVYGSLAYTNPIGFGATFEYKDYRFDPVDPIKRIDANRPTRVLPMQNPPIVHKEHAFTLLSRNPHVIDFNDEIGWQFDAFQTVGEGITVNLNLSQASRHKKYSVGGGIPRVVDSVGLFPATAKEYSPFFEIYTDVEWYFQGQSFVQIAFNRRFDAPYEDFGGLAHVTSSTTVPVHFSYELDEVYTISGSMEHQWYHESTRAQKNFLNEFITVTLTHSPTWSATVRLELSEDRTETTGLDWGGLGWEIFTHVWPVAELSYRLADTHTATVSYGRERGGLVCSSGICRVIQPFEGVRFSLSSQI